MLLLALNDKDGRNAAALSFALFAFFVFLFNYDGSGSMMKDAAKFIEAFIAGITTYHLNSPSFKSWTDRAAREAIRVLGLMNGSGSGGMGSRTRRMLGYSLQVQFYLGYSLFLFFAMYELDAWVEETIK
ncbi:MAG: hypothetical protein WAO58_06865 [Fimbriimonadaceae bacterium]